MARKIVIHRPGGYERLTYESFAPAEPGPGEVAIDVAAVGVNYADCVVRMGLYASAKQYVGWPITPGFEVAGTVRAVGPGIDDLAVGTEVLAVTRFGAYSSDLVVPRRQVFATPRGLSLAQAAALPVVFLTAWYALVELAAVPEGAPILVHSAAGGVGGALVQLGKRAGAFVVGVVGRGHKIEAARELGADVVVDRSAPEPWSRIEAAAPQGFRAVFDANGVATLRASYEHLAPTGRLVVYGFHTMMPKGRGRPSWPKLAWSWLRTPRFDPLDLTGKNRSVMGFNLSYLFDEHDVFARAMSDLLDGVERGDLRPPPVTEVPFDQVARAHQALESGDTVGKLVLVR